MFNCECVATKLAKCLHLATPNGCLVSGPVDFQIGMRAGGIGHYISLCLNVETFAVFRLVTAFLVTCENADVQ